VLPGGARLPVGAIPHGAAWPRPFLRRVVRAHFRGRAGALRARTAYRVAGHLLWHDGRRRGGRRLPPAHVRSRERRQPRDLYRGDAGIGLTLEAREAKMRRRSMPAPRPRGSVMRRIDAAAAWINPFLLAIATMLLIVDLSGAVAILIARLPITHIGA